MAWTVVALTAPPAAAQAVGVNRGTSGYRWAPTAERRVNDTALQGVEYDMTRVGVGVQGLVPGRRVRF